MSTDYLFDNTVSAVDLDKIADANRPLQHQYPAADEVVDDVLCTETHADRYRTGDKRKRGQRYAQQAERRHQDDEQNRVINDAAYGGDGVRADVGCVKPARDQPVGNFPGDVAEQQDKQHEHDLADKNAVAVI